MASKQLALAGESALDKVVAQQASKVAVLLPPYVTWPLVGGVGAAFHALWGDGGQATAWSAIGCTIATGGLSLVTWLVSHGRGLLGRGSATATTAAVGSWVTVASITGPTAPVTGWLWGVGGLSLCAAWNIRTVIREKHGMSGHVDPLGHLFDAHKEKAGLGGARVRTIEAGERKIEAAMALPAGQKTVGDVQKKVEYIESALGLPPGTLTVAPNMDRADLAQVTLSDPRIMRRPIPWPGPSRPGGSISEPLRPGVWQDGDDVQHTLPGHHVQVMGQTGSGKSIGAAWNYLAEIVSRTDTAVFAIDITKGEQSIGMFRPAMHRFETTKAGARSLINDVHAQLKARTDWLSERGMVKWEPGCGLLYWVLWIEEAPDVFDALGDKGTDTILKLLKAIRSAGGSVVLSLQRSDWSQMPTIARGQLAKLCFGVESSADASFGLSEAQSDAGARPELWGSSQPGMAYIDAPSIDQGRIAMPLRTFGWLDGNGEPDVAAVTAYAAQWPAAAKQMDQFTARLAKTSGPADTPVMDEHQDDDDEGFDVTAACTTPDDDPELTASLTMDSPIEDPPDDEPWEFTRPQGKMSREEARALLEATIAGWATEGRTEFTTADLSQVWIGAGMSRSWARKQVEQLRKAGVLDYDDERQVHLIVGQLAGV